MAAVGGEAAGAFADTAWRQYVNFAEALDEGREVPECMEEHRDCADTLKSGMRQALRTALNAKALERPSAADGAEATLLLMQQTLRGQTCRFGNHIFSKKTSGIIVLNLLKLLPEPMPEAAALKLADTAAQLAEQIGRQDFAMLQCFLSDAVSALEAARSRPFRTHAFAQFVQRCKAAMSESAHTPVPGLSVELGSPARLAAFCARLLRLSAAFARAAGHFACAADVDALWGVQVDLAMDAMAWLEQRFVEVCDAVRIVSEALRGLGELLGAAAAPGSLQLTSLHAQLRLLDAIAPLAAFALEHCGPEAERDMAQLACRAIERFDEDLLFPRLTEVLQPFWPRHRRGRAAAACGVFVAAAARFGGIRASAEDLLREFALGDGQAEGSTAAPLSAAEHRALASALERLGAHGPVVAHAVSVCRPHLAAGRVTGPLLLSVRALAVVVLAAPRPEGDVAAELFLDGARALFRSGAPPAAAPSAAEGSSWAVAAELALDVLATRPELAQQAEREATQFLAALARAASAPSPPAGLWRMLLLALHALLARPSGDLLGKLRVLQQLLPGAPPHMAAAVWVAVGGALRSEVSRRLGRPVAAQAGEAEPEEASWKLLLELVSSAVAAEPPPQVLAALAYAFPLLVACAYTVPGLRATGERARMPQLSQVFGQSPYACPRVLAALGLPMGSPANPISAASALAAPPAAEAQREEADVAVPLPAPCCFCGGSPALGSDALPRCVACGMAAPRLDWGVFGAAPDLRLPAVWAQLRSGRMERGAPPRSCCWLTNAKELIDLLVKLTKAALDGSARSPLSLLEPGDTQPDAAGKGDCRRRLVSDDLAWLLGHGLFALCAASPGEQLQESSQAITELFRRLLPLNHRSSSESGRGSAPGILTGLVQSTSFVVALLHLGSRDSELQTPTRPACHGAASARTGRATQVRCHQWRVDVLGAAADAEWFCAPEGPASAQDAEASSQALLRVPPLAAAVAPLSWPAALRAVFQGGAPTGALTAALASLIEGAVVGRPPRASIACLQHIVSFGMLAPLCVDDLFCALQGGMHHRLFERFSRRNARVRGLCELFLRGSLTQQVRLLLPHILPAMVLHRRMKTIQELCALLEESAPSLFTPQLPYILSTIAQQPIKQVTEAFTFILQSVYSNRMTLANICDASLGKVLVLILWSGAGAEGGELEGASRAMSAVENIVGALMSHNKEAGTAADTGGPQKRGAGASAGGAAQKKRAGPAGTAIDVFAEPRGASPGVRQTLETSFLHVLDILEIVFTGNRQSPKWAEYSELLRAPRAGAGESLDHRRLFVSIALLFELVQDSLHKFAPKTLEFLQSATQVASDPAESVRCWQQYVKFVGVARLKPLLPAVVGELLRLIGRLRPAMEPRHMQCMDLVSKLVEATCRQHDDLVAFLPALPQWPELKAARAAVQHSAGARKGDSFPVQLQRAVAQLQGASQQAVKRAALSHIGDLIVKERRSVAFKITELDVGLLAGLMQALLKFLWESSAWPNDQLKCGELLGSIGAIDPSTFANVGFGRSHSTRAQQDLGNIDLMVTTVLVDFLAPNLTSKNSYAFAVQEILKHLRVHGQANRILGALKEDMREALRPYLQSSYQLVPGPSDRGQGPGIAEKLYDGSTFEGVVAQAVALVQSQQRALFEACLPAIQGNHALALFLMQHVVHDLLSSNTPLQDLSALSSSLAALLDSPGHETAQAVFSLVDDVIQRRENAQGDIQVSRTVDTKTRDKLISRIEQLRKSITNRTIVGAAVRCGAHARALRFLEDAIVDETLAKGVNPFDSPTVGEEDCLLLQSVYRDLDEPDGVLGALRIGPATATMRTLQLEQASRWHDAQACYEEQLGAGSQGRLAKQEVMCGLVRCSQNMRRFEASLRLIRGMDDEDGISATLRPFAVEAAWQLSSWERLDQALGMPSAESAGMDTFPVTLGQSLLAFHKKDATALASTLSEATLEVTRTVASAARESYTRAYQHLLRLHVLSDIAWLAECREKGGVPKGEISQRLLARAEETSPTYLARQMVLSPLRVALGDMHLVEDAKHVELELLRLSRKHSVPIAIEHPATSFSAVSEKLRARAQVEWGKLLYSRGDRHDALQHITSLGQQHPKAKLLGTRWATEPSSELLIPKVAEAEFEEIKDKLPEDEAVWFYHAAYLDQLLKEQMASKSQGGAHAAAAAAAAATAAASRSAAGRGPPGADVCPFDLKKLVMFTVRGYLQALHRGNKRIHLILNRVLQLAWDCCELDLHKVEALAEIDRQSSTMEPWMWYVVLPQLISRVHNKDMTQLFQKLIISVLSKYPDHAFWHTTQLLRATNSERHRLGLDMARHVARQDREVHEKMHVYHLVTADLNDLATAIPPEGNSHMSLQKSFSKLLGGPVFSGAKKPWRILVPLQQQMTACIPRMRSQKEIRGATFDAFPERIYAERCEDQVDVFRTKERPKKLVFIGTDGVKYPFLCKAERRGDLRKDSRMMMFGVMVNQLLEQHPDAHRRNLHLVTFNVVILQESCGLIEWVSKTRGMRHVIDDLWKRTQQGPQQSLREIKDIFDRSKDLHETFTKLVLPRHPPMLQKWFSQSADPSIWLSKRMMFSRSQALWCMLGYVVGLGDRHGENILLEIDSGRVVHVDFDCLFGKGMLLPRPETVPFRLTQNCVSALGVTGIEGVFRRTCELCMEVLRDRSNKQTLLSVLQVYIADPLIEWSAARQPKDAAKHDEEGIAKARSTIGDVEKKLNGMLNVGVVVRSAGREADSVLSPAERGRSLLGRDRGVGLSVAGQVDELLKAAMCKRNLSEMYVGWQSWV